MWAWEGQAFRPVLTMGPIRKRLLLVLVLALLVSGCSQLRSGPGLNQESDDHQTNKVERSSKTVRMPLVTSEKSHVVVYFTGEDRKFLIPVTLPINPTREAAKVAVEKLLAGPSDKFLYPTFPEGTKVRDIYIQEADRTVYVDLTSQVKKVETHEAKLALDSLVYTITEFPEIEKVQLLIDGKMEQQLSGIKIDRPLPRPLYLNPINDRGRDGKRVTVYFTDPYALYLVPVSVITKDKEEHLFLEAARILVQGPPEGSGLLPTVWPGTKVLGVEVRNGLATINLSKEAVGYGGGTTAEFLLVNSVVQTLTEIKEIDRVQFLIEGEKASLPEGLDISRPLARPQFLNLIER